MADNITYQEAQQSYWTLTQTVTVGQMTNCINDIYTRLQSLTGLNACILYLNGSIVDNGNGSITVPAGSFRFAITSYSQLTFTTGIFGNVESSSTVSVSGNGYIVARYSVTPTSTGANEYFFPTSYQFVTTMDDTTDCLVCEISGGTLTTNIGDFYLANLHNNTNLTNLNVISYNISNRNYYGQFKLNYYDSTNSYTNQLLLVTSSGQIELTFKTASFTGDLKLTTSTGLYRGIQLNTTYDRPVLNLSATPYVGSGTWDPRIASLGDMRAINYSDHTSGVSIQGFAIYNGVHWQASISGIANYSSGRINSAGPHSFWEYSLDLTTTLGFKNYITDSYGIAGLAYYSSGSVEASGEALVTGNSTNDLLFGLNVVTDMSISISAGVYFSINFFFGAYV